MKKPIILFDGICNLCNGSVLFVIRHDKEGRFRFAPLQSAFGEQFVQANAYPATKPESLVLVDGDDVYFKSTAALKIARNLNGLWPLFYVFILVPKPVRDFVYDLVARHRYRIFGKKDQCMVPDEDVKHRFISN